MRSRAVERIHGFYNWEWVTDFYESAFHALIRGSRPPQYDTFVAEMTG